MLSEPPRCRPVPVLALKGADSPRGLHRGHSPGHGSPPGARSTGGGWSLPASWPDPNSLRQVNPDHDERYRGATVTFEPGARTTWHTHPLGQTLIVTSGCGWVQSEGSPKEEVGPGDIVWFPPGERHWHGATATTAMTHIAIAEALDGKSVDWLEKVTDEQYGK